MYGVFQFVISTLKWARKKEGFWTPLETGKFLTGQERVGIIVFDGPFLRTDVQNVHFF